MSIDLPRRPITKEEPYRILFVCLGNICRSPTAEGVFQHQVKQAGLSHWFHIDSAGTGAWHAGERAHSVSRAVAEQRGVQLMSLARQVKTRDFDDFDLLVAMDRSNERDLRAVSNTPGDEKKIILLRRFDPNPDEIDVPDPYYGGRDGFNHVFDVIDRSCRNLLDYLSKDVVR